MKIIITNDNFNIILIRSHILKLCSSALFPSVVGISFSDFITSAETGLGSTNIRHKQLKRRNKFKYTIKYLLKQNMTILMCQLNLIHKKTIECLSVSNRNMISKFCLHLFSVSWITTNFFRL